MIYNDNIYNTLSQSAVKGPETATAMAGLEGEACPPDYTIINVLYYTTLYYTMLCYAILYYTMTAYYMICYTMI